MSAPILATYRIRADAAEAARIARFIAYEQTVELPEALVVDPFLLEQVVGHVLSVAPADDGCFHARIAFEPSLASGQLSQLLNLVYGNVSMYPGIRLQALDLPPAVVAGFRGPGFGIAGLRTLTGAHDRPLLATAVKPRGLPVQRLAHLAADFARGGGDIVKDDQNLVDEGFDGFRARVGAIADAVTRANAATGGRTLYFPHLAARHEDIHRYAAFVREVGLRGVLLCPHVLGLDTARDLAQAHGLVHMAHPALSGALTQAGDNGIEFGLALGTLLRLAGADISVFVAPGGRFRFSPAQAMRLAAACREPLGALAPAFPCPAGGMDYAQLPQLCERYGHDAVLLVGGALQAHDPDFARATDAYRSQIERCAARAGAIGGASGSL
ncbi:MAG: RuBisCO large subunit C-terminal-like domain-containing protein [Pseudomonadota bacterium]|jgi:ribulose-bisphosphate carboxylase large chain